MARFNTALTSASISGTATIGSPNAGSFTNLTGTAPYTVTVPDPRLHPGVNQVFYNATSGTVTLTTPSGNFNGTGGNGTASMSVFAGNVVSITSDGAHYVVISEDGSALTATTGSFSGNVTMNGSGATVSITPSTLTVAPTGASTIDSVAIGSTTRAAGAFTSLAANAAVTFTANTASSSTGTGTLVVTGGVGVSGQVTATAVSATNLTGTLQTAAQPNITSLGTLTGLTVNASNIGTLNLGSTGASYVAASMIGTASTLYAPVGKLSFRLPTHGANTDYGLTEQMFIEGTGPDSRGAYKISMLQHGGNVGIGTASPSWPLTVKSGSSGTVATFLYDGAFAGTGEANIGLRWYNGGNASDIPQVKLRGYGTTNYTGNFGIDVLVGGTYPNGFLERFTIQGTTGNVGIGATNPTVRLEVNGNIKSASIDINQNNNLLYFTKNSGTASTDANNSHFIGRVDNAGYHVTTGGGGFASVVDSFVVAAKGSLILATSTPTTTYSTGRVMITETGNVGIGTTNPAVKLDVVGAITASSAITTSTRTVEAGGFTANTTYYVKVFTNAGGVEKLSFKMTSSNGSEYGAEVEAFIPAYSSFSGYGTNAMPQISTRVDGLKAQAATFINVLYTSPSNGTSEIWLQFYVDGYTTRQITLSENPGSVPVTWTGRTTTAPSNILKTIAFTNAAKTENGVTTTYDGNVLIGTTLNNSYRTIISAGSSANTVLNVLALHNGSNAAGSGTGARLLFKLSNFESAVENRKFASIEAVGTSNYNESNALVFKTLTSASGGTDPAERMRIDSVGNLIISSRQIQVQGGSFSVASGGTFIFNLEATVGLYNVGLLYVMGRENGVNQTIAIYSFNLSYYGGSNTRYVRLKEISRNSLENGYGNVYAYISAYAASWTTTEQATSGTSTSISDIYFRNAVGQGCQANYSLYLTGN